MHYLAKKHFEKILKKDNLIGLNKKCNYYPCHSKIEDCTWCYCPFYPCKDETLGKFYHHPKLPPQGIWDCSDCTWIHQKDVSQEVFNEIKKLGIRTPQEIEKYHEKLIKVKNKIKKKYSIKNTKK